MNRPIILIKLTSENTDASSSVPNKKELKQIISNEKINDLNYTHQQTQNKHFNKRTEYIINTFSKSQNI